jgi:nitroreductase
MNVFDTIRTRRSIRRYKTDPVEEEKLQRILEAGRLSPSAVNKQPWHFIVVRDPSVRESLRTSYGQNWFVNAWIRRDGEEYWKVDSTIALQDMILCATEEGLGTCWIGAFSEEPARRALKIPEKIRIVAMTPVGYADEGKEPVSDRKPLNEITHYEYW